MAPNIVEKNAQALNQLLRTEGKKYGKAWRSRIRELLAQTFAALNAKPLDGALCLRLSEQIESELQAIESGTVDTERGASKSQAVCVSSAVDEQHTREVCHQVSKEDLGMTERQGAERESGELQSEVENLAGARMPLVHSAQGEPCMAEGHSGAGAQAPDGEGECECESRSDVLLRHVPADEVGLFDLIRVRIRCFFKINACVRPPYIGRFVRFADKFSEVVHARIDKFIGVLDKGDEDFVAKTEVEVGYRDELIPDMPDMGLVLHPKKKKKR